MLNSKNQLTLVPTEGLTNRMRTMASAIAFCQEQGMSLSIIWQKHKECYCHFTDLFQPLSPSGVKGFRFREKRWFDLFYYLRPRRRYLYLAKLMHWFKSDVCMHFTQLNHIAEHYQGAALGQHMASLLKGKKALLFSCFRMCDYPDALNAALFKPTEEIEQRIRQRLAPIKHAFIGVHIRRTDHYLSKTYSTIDTFVDEMKKAEQMHQGAHFYLATDDDEVKQRMQQEFPGRVHYAESTASRTSVEGMKEAVVDLFALARADYFIGSFASSFSRMVLALNGAKGVIAKSPDAPRDWQS
ncbi:MAG: hypothetical protein Q4B68_02620 [Bacteroidales bacterium]|nr:hypothetical protein [Bacteroidales bacterium]